ncbi:hypothetical protein LDENG_00283800, partial [Lucifuga dentata]
VSSEQLCLPRRLFCPVKGAGPVCVCDYQFSDEGLAEVTDRLKEMLDLDAAQEDLDTDQETAAETIESILMESAGTKLAVETPMDPKRNNYIGVAMATVVALLATAASLLYLDDF